MVPWFTSGFQMRQGMQQNTSTFVLTSKLSFKVQFFAETNFRVFKSFAKIAKIRFSRKFPLIRYFPSFTTPTSHTFLVVTPHWFAGEASIPWNATSFMTINWSSNILRKMKFLNRHAVFMGHSHPIPAQSHLLECDNDIGRIAKQTRLINW